MDLATSLVADAKAEEGGGGVPAWKKALKEAQAAGKNVTMQLAVEAWIPAEKGRNTNHLSKYINLINMEKSLKHH